MDSILGIVGLFVIFLLWRRSILEVAAEEGRFLTNAAWLDWLERNPGVYVGLSPEGRKLLSDLIRAYDRFVVFYPDLRDDEHRAWLMSLFNHLPPKSPQPVPIPRRRRFAASFFIRKSAR
jgi:hypothetical protein